MGSLRQLVHSPNGATVPDTACRTTGVSWVGKATLTRGSQGQANQHWRNGRTISPMLWGMGLEQAYARLPRGALPCQPYVYYHL